MTQPPPSHIPPFDQGNQLLAEGPAQLSTTLMDTPARQRLVLTVRTGSTTVSALLAGADAKAWAAQLTRDSALMSSSRLVVANGAVPR